jgi:hypothetical protein
VQVKAFVASPNAALRSRYYCRAWLSLNPLESEPDSSQAASDESDSDSDIQQLPLFTQIDVFPADYHHTKRIAGHQCTCQSRWSSFPGPHFEQSARQGSPFRLHLFPKVSLQHFIGIPGGGFYNDGSMQICKSLAHRAYYLDWVFKLSLSPLLVLLSTGSSKMHREKRSGYSGLPKWVVDSIPMPNDGE